MRIDIVYSALIKLADNHGITASELADALALSRADVSNDLDKLVEEGKATKTLGEPMLFRSVERVTPKQAKTAVLYSPEDINMSVQKEAGVEDEIEKSIAEYFDSHNSEDKFDIKILGNVVSPKVLQLTQEIIRYVEIKLQYSLGNSIYYVLATHIEKSVEWVKQNKSIVNQQLNHIRTDHEKIFNIALDCLPMIERAMDIDLPIDEAGFLTMIFVNSGLNVEKKDNNVQVIVVAHGKYTASAMVETANELLGVSYAVAFDVPLEEKVQDVLERIIGYIQAQPVKSDILLLVDMGSLTTFGAAIENRLKLRVKTIKLISTIHVIEAVQIAMNGHSLDDVYRSVLAIGEYRQKAQESPIVKVADTTVSKKLAIVTLCATSGVTARVMDNLLSRLLTHRKSVIEIICLSLNDETDIYQHLDNIQRDYTIVAIISPFHLNTSIIQFDLKDVLLQKGVNQLQEIIDLEATYTMIEGTLTQVLQHIESSKILIDIKAFNFNVSKALNISPSSNMLIGLTMHIACMLDRLKSGKFISHFPDKESYLFENAGELKIIKQEVALLEQQLQVVLPDDELCSLHRFFLHT